MLPIAKRVLRLREIAEYWSREIDGVRPSDEILGELFSAFWRNELHVTGMTGNNKVDRLAILKIVKRRREHPGFTLIENAEELPPAAETRPDGSVLIDLTNYIILPSNEAAWTKELVDVAYERLATKLINDFDDLITPGLEAFSTTRDALRNYCAAKEYHQPPFWFGRDRSTQWTTRREREARVWLKQIAVGPKQKPKPGYFADTQKQFPGIPHDAFERIWKEVVPSDWKRRGPVVRAPGPQTHIQHIDK